jgi:curved DNA-binding protein CbpA
MDKIKNNRNPSMTKEILECFELLEVSPSASLDEVKRARNEMSKVWHTDRFSPDDVKLQSKALEKMKQINTAYEKLKDFYKNPENYKADETEDSGESKNEAADSSGAEMNSKRKADEEKENSRIPEAVIQAKFDKNSTLNSPSFGWSVILGAILIIAWNIFRWMPFLKSNP